MHFLKEGVFRNVLNGDKDVGYPISSGRPFKTDRILFKVPVSPGF